MDPAVGGVQINLVDMVCCCTTPGSSDVVLFAINTQDLRQRECTLAECTYLCFMVTMATPAAAARLATMVMARVFTEVWAAFKVQVPSISSYLTWLCALLLCFV